MRTTLQRKRICALTILGSIGSFFGTMACFSPDNPLPDNLNSNGSGECGDLTYENFAQNFFAQYCLRCHSDALTGDLARSDAPVGINFNTLAGVREFERRIRLRAGELGDMPPALLPVPKPSAEERQMLMEWIDCDTPSEGEAAAP